MNVEETGYVGMKWIQLVHNMVQWWLLWIVMNLVAP